MSLRKVMKNGRHSQRLETLVAALLLAAFPAAYRLQQD